MVNIRTGVALSGNSGLLPLLKTLFSTGLGGSFGDGNFWFSWIAMDDLTDIYTRAIVDHRISGAVNATAPEPVLNKDMAKALGTELNRPTLLPIPTFGPKLLLGKEGAHELALADQRVSSAKIRQLGHNFRFSTIEAALAHELEVNNYRIAALIFNTAGVVQKCIRRTKPRVENTDFANVFALTHARLQ